MPLREAAGRSIPGPVFWHQGLNVAGRCFKRKISADASAGFGNRGVGVEVHLLVFHQAPEALNEHIVAPATLSIHADGDLLAVEDGGEGRTGKL
jgi:hypothetical protein